MPIVVKLFVGGRIMNVFSIYTLTLVNVMRKKENFWNLVFQVVSENFSG